MNKFGQMFKVNKLGPLGLLGGIGAIAGVVFPWMIVDGKPVNGTFDILGWVLILVSILYIMILYTNFKWNILLALVVKIIALYKYFDIMSQTRNNPKWEPGLGIYILLLSGLAMVLGTILLFRKKNDPEE